MSYSKGNSQCQKIWNEWNREKKPQSHVYNSYNQTNDLQIEKNSYKAAIGAVMLMNKNFLGIGVTATIIFELYNQGILNTMDVVIEQNKNKK